ncbi:ThiF family adenylyltransferase [Mammaliicoccus sp. Dog046]|uniref:ThiF family adenylyltransferase n=1 Tax=Mammaliicoccus sp. Dog046 TaxID=3034233 RepID=UPI002B25E502|nr:ThiF family adenylyltransferase [Mammaliicoccus sp. Dog046]WQK85772.1 ThiF family adenylyltransferase [Mammaliicoccus sp. Dog046]
MQRYDRQMKYHRFGENGQNQLQHTNILIFGAGALGSHVAELLARMGAEHLTIIDMDIVELSNLHRQALYDEHDAQNMLPKVYALKDKIKRINHNVQLNSINEEITSTNILDIIEDIQPDIIIDGMDQFDMRFLINEASHKSQIPWIYGAAVGSKGTVYGIDFNGPCLKCILSTVPSTGESCAINGVLPPVIQQVASYQVSELLRHVSGEGFSQKLITLDTFEITAKMTKIDQLKNHQCEVCVNNHYESLNKLNQPSIESLCGDTYLFRFKPQTFQFAHYFPGNIIKENDYVKFLRHDNINMTLFKDGRMNVHGANSQQQAEQLYQELSKSIK